MAIIDPIKVEGLAEFRRNLRTLDSNLGKAMRIALNESADIVVDWAQPHVPSRSGRARGSIRAKSTQTEARVEGGGKRVPYYPWLDFGGRVGRKRSVKRPFIKSGRAIYPGYTRNRQQVHDRLLKALLQVCEESGVGVD
jgi:hypothetical protein